MCPYCGLDKCKTNKHHRVWPRRNYKSKLERMYRELPCNIVVMCMQEHFQLHRVTKPPKKPKADVMRQAIERHNRKECQCGSDAVTSVA